MLKRVVLPAPLADQSRDAPCGTSSEQSLTARTPPNERVTCSTTRSAVSALASSFKQ